MRLWILGAIAGTGVAIALWFKSRREDGYYVFTEYEPLEIGGGMWRWESATGRMMYKSELVKTGYAGAGAGKNNPAMEDVPMIGPIPRGTWRIGDPYNHVSIGEYVIPLVPEYGTETYGRSGFLIHGDSLKAPGTASKGCIVLHRAARERIVASGDRRLEVV